LILLRNTPEGQTAALRRAVPLVARIRREDLRDEYARRLAGWTGWRDEFMVVRRVREEAGVPAERVRGRRQPPPPPARDDPRLHVQREALKAALQVPAVAGPAFDELPPDGFTHPAFAAIRSAIEEAGGVCGELRGQAWLEAVLAHCTSQARPLVTELAVEPMELPQKNFDEARYVSSVLAGVRLALVEAEIAELKSRLQRINPIEDPEASHQLFGDLVPLEQYRIALREQAFR
jgi:DNA primase